MLPLLPPHHKFCQTYDLLHDSFGSRSFSLKDHWETTQGTRPHPIFNHPMFVTDAFRSWKSTIVAQVGSIENPAVLFRAPLLEQVSPEVYQGICELKSQATALQNEVRDLKRRRNDNVHFDRYFTHQSNAKCNLFIYLRLKLKQDGIDISNLGLLIRIRMRDNLLLQGFLPFDKVRSQKRLFLHVITQRLYGLL